MDLIELFRTENSDEKSLSFIVNALEKSNLQGFDYLEFIQAVEKLKNLPMEEELAFRSAFSTVSTVGLDKASLLETSQYYLEVLQKERKVFKQSVEDRRLIKIERQKRRIESLEKEVESLKKRIEELQLKINDYNQEQEEIKQSLGAEEEKIFLTEKIFDETIESVISKIESDIKLIRNVI